MTGVTLRAGIWASPSFGCYEGKAELYRAQGDSSHKQLDVYRRHVVKVLHDAGVRLLLSGEGAYLADELLAFVRAGLTPYQALRTGTYNVEEYLSKLDTRGTIAVGKQADLVLLSGNPLQDIQHVREPVGVMNGGRWFDRAEVLAPTPIRRANFDMMARAWLREQARQGYRMTVPGITQTP